ncbi:YiaA/YiaB family inner membrane protein [Inhella gelatinilytica]|uniref:YiaAB two helix domain-containing protein n=1 Tax=Inhella gelatinilytica TaxID=2795030 RepID=A0A931ITF9_9BURK|nr:YiaA/YiaB family inner membrane protein [Inhella gelatinilytica]MBH9551814.1 hypothetical protein [Inhella gelatinilytica]
MPRPLAPRHDTRAWQIQVWVSFGVAVLLCGSGLAYLPVSPIERAFLVMAYVFCLCTVFALAKFVRDRHANLPETPAWGLVVWGGFGAAMALTGWGLWVLEIPSAFAAYLLVAWLFLISAAFTLAKTLRDAHEDRLALGFNRPTPTPSESV